MVSLLLRIGATFAVALSFGLAVPSAQAGFPFLFKKRSDEWYAAKACEPVGARQKCYKGKLWPPYARPSGEALPWIHRYHAAHYWPYPYVEQDREFVREAAQRQVNNGWIVATTLYDYHFSPDTDDLTRAGRLQLRWILENAPLSHRMIFVQAADYADSSQARLKNVRDAAGEIVGAANVPSVMLRVTSPLSRPAEEVRKIRDAELESQPNPRITNPIESGGGGESADLLSSGSN